MNQLIYWTSGPLSEEDALRLGEILSGHDGIHTRNFQMSEDELRTVLLFEPASMTEFPSGEDLAEAGL